MTSSWSISPIARCLPYCHPCRIQVVSTALVFHKVTEMLSNYSCLSKYSLPLSLPPMIDASCSNLILPLIHLWNLFYFTCPGRYRHPHLNPPWYLVSLCLCTVELLYFTYIYFIWILKYLVIYVKAKEILNYCLSYVYCKNTHWFLNTFRIYIYF